MENSITDMRKFIFFVVAAAILAGCAKENEPATEDLSNVLVSALLQMDDTKAVIDGDGAGVGIDNWVIEVRDVLQPDVVYYHNSKSGDKGAHTQTFDLVLVKNHTYDIAFWADAKGSFNVSNLKDVSFSDISKIGNADSLDAFYACKRFTADGTASMTARLYRPFAQVNVITTDLPAFKSGSTDAAYASYKPCNFSFKTTLPTKFNAFTGEAGTEQEVTIKPVTSLDSCYGDYAAAAEYTTVHMVYVLANRNTTETDIKDVRDIDFAFKSGNVDISYDFTSIPLKRNYRTNIIGKFLTNTTEWRVEVVPDWTGEIDVTE